MKVLRLVASCLTILFVVNSFSVQGQSFAEERWNQGLVILKNNDTLRGFLKYNVKNAVLRVKVNNTIKTFSPRTVVSFLFFDLSYHHNRQFYSIPYAIRRGSSYKVPSFFELVLNGNPITLLSRQTTIIQHSNRMVGAYRRVEQDTFFLLDVKGNITKLKTTRRAIYRALNKHERAIKTYMQVNGLKHSKRSDLIKVIDYYNSLSNNNDR